MIDNDEAAQRKYSRRGVLRASTTTLIATALLTVTDRASDRQAVTTPLLINHLGFTPEAGKFALASGKNDVAFTITNSESGKVVRKIAGVRTGGDLGSYCVADFSDLVQPGNFEISTEDGRSASFQIDARVYAPAIAKCIDYFLHQRCGDSKTGYHAPCHLDDGRRLDNGGHQNVSGGWHDACDLRKWVDATIYGMIGLGRVVELGGLRSVNAQTITAELEWGNRYFLRMQEQPGYVMQYCGGDDGNHFTDNIIGTGDDRPIHTDPADLTTQFLFVGAEALAARCLDGDNRRASLQAAVRCYDWCLKERGVTRTRDLAAGLIAGAQLYLSMDDAGKKEKLVSQVADFARLLFALQLGEIGEAGGAFRAKPDDPRPYRDIQHGNLPLLAACEVIEVFPDHPDIPYWKKCLAAHVEHLHNFSQRSAFNILPFGLYSEAEGHGNRKAGSYRYRWFMKPVDETPDTHDWWVGNNAHLASTGIGLARAGRILQMPVLTRFAQRHLDWVLGSNPFGCSFISGVGHRQPTLYKPGTFYPPTPPIIGGVMNGIGGTENDEPLLQPGSWQNCEYWTPMVGYTIWLMSELDRMANA